MKKNNQIRLVENMLKFNLKKIIKELLLLFTGDDNLEFIDENYRVLIADIERKGYAFSILPDFRFKVIHIDNIWLNALFRGKKEKTKFK